MKVGLLAGGRYAERDVSLGTAAVVRAGLISAGHQVVSVMIERSGAWVCDGDSLRLSPGEGFLGCDVVFPALHGLFGEVQGALELLDVPYVGAGVLASSLCMDRAAFKDALAAGGFPQARYVTVREWQWRGAPQTIREEVARLGIPVFVKPAHLGSSVGIVKVTEARRLHLALETAFSHDGTAVVEESSRGVEVECAVLGLSQPETSVPGQIILRGGYTLATPAAIPDHVAAEVRSLARETFLRVGCAGLACVDFFVDDERVLVNEVNTLPGFTRTSDFPKLWEATGITLPVLCDRLIDLAIERFRIERRGHAF